MANRETEADTLGGAAQVDFMTSGEVVKFELEGDDAVRRWREILGPTNSKKRSVPKQLSRW